MNSGDKTGTKKILCTLLISAACFSAIIPSAYAGKEGVFVANDTYFTLENATLSTGTDSSTMQFVINLHNGGQGDIDFNSYGVRIVDDEGNRYPAKLTSKQNARVTPGHDQEFRFISEVAAGVLPNRMKVNLYAWNGSTLSAATNLGDLSFAAVTGSETAAPQQQLISLNEIDPAYAPEALVSFRLGSSYQLMEAGAAYLYTDVYVQNIGSSGVQLPPGLQLRLKAADSATYSGAFTGNGQTAALLPGKQNKLTLRTAVADSLIADQFSLEMFVNNSSGEQIMGSLPLTGTTNIAEIGSEQPYSLFGTNDGLTIRAERAIAVKQEDGYLLRSMVTIRNDGAKITALPAISAAYQFGADSINADGQDQSVKTGFLSPQQSATYQFTVALPEGMDPKTVNLVVFEQKTAAAGTVATNTAPTNNTANTQSKTTSATTDTQGANSSAANRTGSTGGNGGSTATDSNANSNSGSAGSSNSTNTNPANANAKTGSADKNPILLVSLSGVDLSSTMFNQAQPYQLAAPLPIAPNGWLNKNIEVSMVELHMHKNSDLGYNTAVAKYKITNRGSTSLAMPDLGTELINTQGLSYTGVRQSTAANTIMPNTSYVISYSYMLPASETGQQLALNLSGPGKLSVGTYNVAAQSESTDKLVSFYPFDVSFDAYNITTLYSSSGFTYNLNLTLKVDIKEPVIIDQNFSQMEFELLDNLDRVVAAQTMSFTGTQKIISGEQKVTFTNVKSEQFDNKMKVNVYETITTPTGPAKRLVQQLSS